MHDTKPNRDGAAFGTVQKTRSFARSHRWRRRCSIRSVCAVPLDNDIAQIHTYVFTYIV